jgi:hypothetical protein
MKKSILVLAAIIGSYFAQAQVNFGGQVGFLSSSNIETYDGIKKAGKKSVFGFRIGAFAEMPVIGGIFFNPALNFVSKGGKHSSSLIIFGATSISESEITTNYLEIPLNFIYKINLEKGRFYFGAGPVVGFGLGGKAKGSGTSTGSFIGIPINQNTSYDTKIKFDGKRDATDGKVHLKALEMGANLLVGFEMRNGIRLQINFNSNFTNLSPDVKNSFTNTNRGFTIGYKFGAAKK